VLCAVLSKMELDVYLTKYDLKRLEMYSKNLVDYHLIMDLIPSLARLYFLSHMGDTHLSAVQSVCWVSIACGYLCVKSL
jgi:N-acetyltransferase 10